MNILIVDDSPTNRHLLTQFLKIKGHTVAEAENGQKAVEYFVSHKPDLILMDVMMPEMNGYEATKKIRELQGAAWVPVIFASALASINRAVVDALYHIVRDGFLGRLLDWATGHQVGGSAITFSLHPRSSRIPTLARHAMPVAHACFSTIDISDYRTWQEMYQHLIQVLRQSRFLFGRP